MTDLPRTLPEVLIAPVGPGAFLASNLFTRTHALGDGRFALLLAELTQPPTRAELARRLGDAPIRVADATRSPYADGLLGDPTGLDRTVALTDGEALELEETLDLVRRLQLAVDDEVVYAAGFGVRENMFDRRRRGSMHQRVGDYVVLELRRRDIDEWWVEQKFTEDRREVRPGPYRYVQWPFMSRYFTHERIGGRRVLDFGCGPGLFSRLFARAGAQVLGVDTNASHLETARRLTADDGLAGRVEYRLLEHPLEDALDAFAAEQFDLVFLSDVLMFYFHPYDPRLALDPGGLLVRLRAALSSGGVIGVLEPQGAFWQRPRLGSADRPMTVLTEYRHKREGVTPTLERLSRAAEQAGLAITKVREIVPPADGDDDGDARGFAYAREFPLWWYFELRPRP